MEPFINVWVGRDGREPIVTLSLAGFPTTEAAIPAIIENLKTEGVDGDEGGKVLNADATEDGISVETDRCGFFIDKTFIAEAVAKPYRRVSC